MCANLILHMLRLCKPSENTAFDKLAAGTLLKENQASLTYLVPNLAQIKLERHILILDKEVWLDELDEHEITACISQVGKADLQLGDCKGPLFLQ